LTITGYGHVLIPSFDASLFGISVPALKAIIADCQRRRQVSKEAQQLRISPAKADDLLDRDTRQTALFLRSVTPVSLNQNQFDALCSIIFNIGQGAYAESTLRKKLRAGDYAGAAAEFPRWVYGTVNGKKVKLAGLERRRKNEQSLFLGEKP
jgi:lysozyme